MRSIPGTITEHPVARATRENRSTDLRERVEAIIKRTQSVADEGSTDSPFAREVARDLRTALEETL